MAAPNLNRLVRFVNVETIASGELPEGDPFERELGGTRQYVAKFRMFKKVRQYCGITSVRNDFDNYVVNHEQKRVLMLRVVYSRKRHRDMYNYQSVLPLLYHMDTVDFMRFLYVYARRFPGYTIGVEMDGSCIMPDGKRDKGSDHAVFATFMYTDEGKWTASYYDPNREVLYLVKAFVEAATYLNVTSYHRYGFIGDNPDGQCSGISSKTSMAWIAGNEHNYCVDEGGDHYYRQKSFTYQLFSNVQLSKRLSRYYDISE